jgi:hypothetical protein
MEEDPGPAADPHMAVGRVMAEDPFMAEGRDMAEDPFMAEGRDMAAGMGMDTAIGADLTTEEAPGSVPDGLHGGGVHPLIWAYPIRTIRLRRSSWSGLLRSTSSRRLNPTKRTIGTTAKTPGAITLTSKNVRWAG